LAASDGSTPWRDFSSAVTFSYNVKIYCDYTLWSVNEKRHILGITLQLRYCQIN
jgi:hypothetical protein